MRGAHKNRTRLFFVGKFYCALGSAILGCGGDDEPPNKEPPDTEKPPEVEPLKTSRDTGKEVKGHLEELLKGLGNPEWPWREEAVVKIGNLGKDAIPAVPELVKALEDNHEKVRMAALCALGKIGPPAVVAAPTMVWSLSDANDEVAEAAVGAIAQIGPTAVPALVKLIERGLRKQGINELKKSEMLFISEKEWRGMRKAANTLGKIGPWARGGLKVLMRLMDVDCGSQKFITACLAATSAGSGALTKVGEGAVTQLIAILDDRDPDLRRMAARALGNLGPEAADAVPKLVAMLEDKRVDLSGVAARALGGIGVPAIPALLELLHEKQPAMRNPAVKALIKMGPAAREAKPELERLLKDPKRWTRRAAKDVLAAIR